MNSKDNFFGRREHLAILDKRIRDLKDGYRQNIAIIGEEFIGKTSLISRFLKGYCDTRSLVFYFEVRPEPLNSFSRRFVAVLLYNFMINSGIPLKEDLDFLMAKAAAFIPKTVEKIKYILASLKRGKQNNIFADLLMLSESIYQESGKFCVLVFDEFHNLEAMQLSNLYAEWVKVLMLQKNTMQIIISSLCFKAKATLSKNLSLLFGNFEVIYLEPFDIKVSEDYLQGVLSGSGMEKGKKDFIVHFTGGYPFYLGLVSEAVLSSPGKELADILEKLLFEPCGILYQKFSNFLKRFQGFVYSQDYASLLYLISDGHNKAKDIAHLMRKTTKELNLRLVYLLESDALSRSGEFLRLNDRVFGFWLKFVYRQKLGALSFDAANQRESFRSNIEQAIADFTRSSGRPIRERLCELFWLFENEMVQIERKKIRLDNFREVKAIDFRARGMREGLLGRAREGLWIAALKYELLTERDVIDFSKECKKYRSKHQKKIIFAFRDIEANARLRALEEKIITWDINSLNQVMDLFYKPRVIV